MLKQGDFIPNDFLQTHGSYGKIANFLTGKTDTLRLRRDALSIIASLGHLADHKDQIIGITQNSGSFVLLKYRWKTCDIETTLVHLKEVHIETVLSLKNLEEGLVFMAEFMPGYTSTPTIKLKTLEKYLLQHFSRPADILQGRYSSMLRNVWNPEVENIAFNSQLHKIDFVLR